MDTWTMETGFPIVQLTWFPDRILFRHEKFSLNPPPWDPTATQEAGIWHTPISYTMESSPDFSPDSWTPKFWFQPGTQNRTFPNFEVGADEWMLVNPDARSYYRTIYCGHFLGLILRQLGEEHTVFPPTSRSQLIDDNFKTAPTKGWKNAQFSQAMNLTKYLDKEDNTAVWMTALNNFRPINRLLIDASYYEDFKDYLLSKITPVLDRLGWEQGSPDSERPTNVILRSLLLDWACSLGSPNCDVIAENYVVQLADGQGVPADIQAVIFCKAVSISDSLNSILPIKQHLLQKYQEARRAERFTVFVNSLGCDSINYLEGWLNLITAGASPFSPAHTTTFLQKLADNKENRAILISYFSDNLGRIIQVLGENIIGSVVSTIAGYTSDELISMQLNNFIDAALEVVTNGNVRSQLMASKITMEENVAWLADFGEQINRWLG